MNKALFIVIILLALIVIKSFVVVFLPFQWFLGIIATLGVIAWIFLR